MTTILSGGLGYNPNGIEKVKYLFIDGGALDSTLQQFSNELFDGLPIEIDYLSLAKGFQKVFYYDSLPAQKKNEEDANYRERLKPTIKLFNHLRSLDRFHLYEGTARFRNRKRGQEQKQVDIMIAVDMLTHTFGGNMNEATLLTSDLDFKPLLDALVQQGMNVSLWYQKNRANYELVDAADIKTPLTINKVSGWFTNEFRHQAKLPDIKNNTFRLGSHWEHCNQNEQNDYYRLQLFENKTSRNTQYMAFVWLEDSKNPDEPIFIEHDNLDQLKFYIHHVYSPNVRRHDY